MRRCIELPVGKLNKIMVDIKAVLRSYNITYKRFEMLFGKLRHFAISLPAEKGICAPFNQVIALQPNLVGMGKKGRVYAALLD